MGSYNNCNFAIFRELLPRMEGVDLSPLPENDRKIIGMSGLRLVPQTDGAFDQIRDMVHILHIDLTKLNS